MIGKSWRRFTAVFIDQRACWTLGEPFARVAARSRSLRQIIGSKTAAVDSKTAAVGSQATDSKRKKAIALAIRWNKTYENSTVDQQHKC